MDGPDIWQRNNSRSLVKQWDHRFSYKFESYKKVEN